MYRIDSHQHFWQYNEKDYGWMDDSMSVLKKDYLPKDLMIELKKVHFSGSISVQARQIEKETDWLLKLADENEFIKGVVGWLDIQSKNFEQKLNQYLSHPKFVGLRHIVQDEPDDNFMLRNEFLTGLSIMIANNLPYDILILPRHLSVTQKVLTHFPKHDFVIDHLAKPNIRDKKINEWKEGMGRLAKFPNVRVKLSGMVTEAKLNSWKEEDFKPYLDVVYDLFGADRLIVGSDWPVCQLSCGYESVINIIGNWASSFDISVQEKIFGQNARYFYKLS